MEPPQVCHEGLIFLWGMSGATGSRFGCPIRTEGGSLDLPPKGLHTRLTTSSGCHNFPAGEELLHGSPSNSDSLPSTQNRICVSTSRRTSSWGKHSLLRKQNQGVLGDTGVFYTQFGIPELSQKSPNPRMQLCLGKLATRLEERQETLKPCISPRQDSETPHGPDSRAKRSNSNFLYTAESHWRNVQMATQTATARS